MNWSLTECYANLAFERSGGFFNSKFGFQGSENFPSRDTEEDIIEQRKKDQDFINEFISNIQQNSKVDSKNGVKISEAKNLLLEIINEKQNIEKQLGDLDVNDENFNCKYETLAVQLNDINNRILQFNNEIKTPLKAAIHKRLKKRKAIKERRENRKAFKKLQVQKLQEKHNIIDKLLNEKSEEVEIIKHEAALKRQADTVLHEVRRKKYEAKKMLNLLVALAKLRELRSNEEKKRGGYSSEQLTETFNKVMLRFQDLWEKQLEVYKLEEKGLKIMLDESTLPHKKESKLETNLLQWEKALFGDVINEKYEELITLPETDIQALIQIRQEWDQFLTEDSTPMASGIPLGWVLPPETDDELWKAFTKSNNKSSTSLQ